MELIEIVETEINGVIWVTEKYGIDGVIYSENTHPKIEELEEAIKVED